MTLKGEQTMGKSEQMIQNEIFSSNTTILDKYECLSLGATTIRNLMKSSIIRNTLLIIK